jgi:excisionase family DNA binding protein
MKTELEQTDISAIAGQVLETLKPYLNWAARDRTEEDIMDVKGLSTYLKVTPKWVHQRTHLKEIPFYKLSNKQLRFRKRDVDKWLESLRTPAISPLSSRMKLLK